MGAPREERGAVRRVLHRVGEREELALVVSDVLGAEHLGDPHRREGRDPRSEESDGVSGSTRRALLTLGGVVSGFVGSVFSGHSRDENRNPCLWLGVCVVHLSGFGIKPEDVGLVGVGSQHRAGAFAVSHRDLIRIGGVVVDESFDGCALLAGCPVRDAKPAGTSARRAVHRRQIERGVIVVRRIGPPECRLRRDCPLQAGHLPYPDLHLD